jgi:hypothetical protein
MQRLSEEAVAMVVGGGMRGAPVFGLDPGLVVLLRPGTKPPGEAARAVITRLWNSIRG